MTPADRKLFTFAGCVAVLLVVASLAVGPSGSGEDSGIPSTYSSTSSGARAAYLLLSDLGYDEHRWEEPPTGLKNLSPGALLILAEPSDGPSKPEREALWSFISSGGRVLFCGPNLAAFFPGRAIVPVSAGHDWIEFTPSVPSRVSRDARKIVLQPHAYWGDPDPSQLRLYGDQHTAAVVDWRFGQGDVLWWAAATPLTNSGISRADNLKLLLNSIAGEHTAIYWDEYFHGQRTGLWSYFEKTPLPWALVQFGLVALGVLFTFSRRSGPVVAAPVVSRLSPLEFVETMGGLYERAGAASIAVTVSYRRLRFELARALSMPVGAADEDLARSAGERLGINAAGLLAALQDAAKMSDSMGGRNVTGGRKLVGGGKKLEPRQALALVRSLEDYSLQLRTPRPLVQAVLQEKT